MQHKSIDRRYCSIHYWMEGQGEQTILFTHGATMDHAMFQKQMAYFANDFRVICWDVPCHGRTRPYPGFTMEKAAEELIRILDAEKISKAHLVGQSMGGYISQIAAVYHPQRVQTITAVDSSPIQSSYYSIFDRLMLSLTPTILKMYSYEKLIHMIADQIAITPEAREYALKTLKTYTKDEISFIMGAVYKGLFDVSHSALSLPILLVYGEQDKTGKVVSYSHRWAEKENRELKVIPNAAHNSNMDNPEFFNKVLKEFLTQ